MNIMTLRNCSPFRRIKEQKIILQGGLVDLCGTDMICSCSFWIHSLHIWVNCVKQQLQKVTQALKDGSTEQAQVVIKEDEEIDQIEKDIERLCLKLFASAAAGCKEILEESQQHLR